MSYTRQMWSIALLHAIGNKVPSSDTINFVHSWTQFETSGPPGAAFNLLNTTEPNTPGVVSDYNSAGVKNYDTFEHGIQANAKVLVNGYYPNLYYALLKNTIVGQTPAYIEMVDKELTTWGTNNPPRNLYAEIVTEMSHLMTDTFPGNAISLPIPDPDQEALDEFYAIPWGQRVGKTGIFQSWLASRKAGMDWGPALTPEIKVNFYSTQYFPSGKCVWNHLTHLPSWEKNF